jgi:hypothetical protein
MTLSVRFLTTPNSVLQHFSGRSYTANSSGIVDIPIADAEAVHVGTRLMFIGATADRPTNAAGRVNWPPKTMYDTTLGKPIFLVAGSNPASWVDITGAAA